MTDANPGGVAETGTGTVERDVFGVLTDEEVVKLHAFGDEITVPAGEVLVHAGDMVMDFFVVLDGAVDISVGVGDDAVVIATQTVHHFVGELASLSDERIQLNAVTTMPSRLLRIERDQLRRLFSSEPDLSDFILRVFISRRDGLLTGEGSRGVQVLGSRFSAQTLALRAFLVRAYVPHRWIDLEESPEAAAMLDRLGVDVSETPLVLTVGHVMRNPTPGELAECLGMSYRPIPGHIFDLVVVGAGPAGLAAAVYGASEGLDTVLLDSIAAGGQAGTSSRIENYLGFPNGISGHELTGRAVVQARKFGARVALPCEVSGLRSEQGWYAVALADGSEIPTRTVIIATGAEYRRPEVEGWQAMEGAGIYYAATETEARLCEGAKVAVVGGGNSAGQAAVFLSQRGCDVHLVIRAADLTQSMSRYLIDRVDADPRISIESRTEIRAVHGSDRLQALTVERTSSGEREQIDVDALFCFIGAVPSTGWLEGCIAADEHGFLLTDRDLGVLDDERWVALGRDPLPFETSRPGVFAVGDVRAGSTKRVAAAVGEGSTAVRSVNQHIVNGG